MDGTPLKSRSTPPLGGIRTFAATDRFEIKPQPKEADPDTTKQFTALINVDCIWPLPVGQLVRPGSYANTIMATLTYWFLII